MRHRYYDLARAALALTVFMCTLCLSTPTLAAAIQWAPQ